MKEQNAPSFFVSNTGPAKMTGLNLFFSKMVLFLKNRLVFQIKIYKPVVPKLRQHTRKAFSRNT